MRTSRLVGWLVGLAMVAVLAAAPAQATVVTALPGGTLAPMPAAEYFGSGPQFFGPGITWTSTNATNQGGSVFGFTSGYGFDANGFWDGSLGPMAGLNDSEDAYPGDTDTMTFSFSTPLAGVGGFINYVPDSENPTVIAIWDSGMNLLESFNLTFTTSGGDNTGEFLGFLRTSSDISYFTLTDNYVGITDLTIQSVPEQVPEPGTLLLLGAGLAGLARKRRA